MEKVRLGKTGLMVTRVGFGGIPIMRRSKADAVQIVKEAISLGINFIDTANGYTDSEEKIGEAIKGMRREDLIIATKSTATDKKTFNEHLDLSLKRLGVDYIDVYQLHNVSKESQKEAIFAPSGAVEGLEEAVKAGKVRFPGFSSHTISVAIEILKSGKFSTVQLPFNYIDIAAADEVFPLVKEHDMGFIVMKPLGGGMLNNAALAFRFLMQYDSIVPIPGIENTGEIQEIVAIVEKNEKLSEEDKKEIEKQRIEFGPSWCHRCDYCQPCPQEIHIAFALWVESAFNRMPADRARSMFGPSIEKARTCLECGACVARCPYNLDIPALLKEKIKFVDSQD
jgi:hypothetical protein